MGNIVKGFPTVGVTVPFVAGDASKVLVAAPGAGKAINVVALNVSITVSAAQSVDIESAGGVVELIKTGISPAVNAQFSFKMPNGIRLPENTALSYVPSGAGNAGLVAVEYFIDGTL